MQKLMINCSIPLKETALESRYTLKNNETFSNLSFAIVSQKCQEFSMQVENRE